MRWMAIKPSSSPRYAFATCDVSENDPIIRPRPFVHSNTKAAEHRFGYCSRRKEPSVTARREPSEMAAGSQSWSPVRARLSHSHVFPQERSTSMNVRRGGVGAPAWATDVRRHPPCPCPACVGSTEQMWPPRVDGRVSEKRNLFGFLHERKTSSVSPSTLDLRKHPESPSHLYSQILCDGAMNTPILVPAIRLGHKSSIASRQV